MFWFQGSDGYFLLSITHTHAYMRIYLQHVYMLSMLFNIDAYIANRTYSPLIDVHCIDNHPNSHFLLPNRCIRL